MTWGKSYSFPKAIIHIDGDAFFASCEQSLHPDYRGKPVVVGKERGIAASMSYEAKKLGVVRGMTIPQIKKISSQIIIVPSDYETYSLFSKRMFAIMRRFSSVVEEYGIDEGFVDITGLRKPLNMGYVAIARRIKQDISRELGISVSAGLAPTKVLAKLASTYDKPDGFATVPTGRIKDFLRKINVKDVWGIGSNTAHYMYKLDINSAYDFTQKDFEYVQQYFTKPHQEIWRELCGELVYPVISEKKTSYASISKTRTFTPASSDKNFVYSQLIKNIENACIKARRYQLAARSISVFLKTQDFKIDALELKLNRASSFPNDLTKVIKPLFEKLYKEGVRYRATGVVLSKLQEDTCIQGSLFESPIRLEQMKNIYSAVDGLAKKFGKHTVHLGASIKAKRQLQHQKNRGDKAIRKLIKLKGECGRKRLNIPMFFGMVR